MDGGELERPSRGEVEARLLDLCAEGDLPRPDRIVEDESGDYIAFWDDSKVAVVIEVEAEEL